MRQQVRNTSASIDTREGTTLLYSYTTCVAGFIPGLGLCKTDKYHSQTTSRHINEFIDHRPCISVGQDVLDDVASYGVAKVLKQQKADADREATAALGQAIRNLQGKGNYSY